MEYFNVSGSWRDNGIIVSNQQYKADENLEYTIEADWRFCFLLVMQWQL